MNGKTFLWFFLTSSFHFLMDFIDWVIQEAFNIEDTQQFL